jgi:hypothetical protein
MQMTGWPFTAASALVVRNSAALSRAGQLPGMVARRTKKNGFEISVMKRKMLEQALLVRLVPLRVNALLRERPCKYRVEDCGAVEKDRKRC